MREPEIIGAQLMASQVSTLFESSTGTSSPVDAMVSRAVDAQHLIESWSEEEIDSLLLALAERVASQAHPLAVAAVEEIGMGNVADKTFKNRVASIGIYEQMAGQKGHGEIAFDAGRQIAEIASPVGVVLGLIPAVHPVATFIFKTLIALKARNAIILSPSRRAARVSQQVGDLIQETLIERGAPVNLVQWITSNDGRQTTAELMRHRHIALVLATGGPGMVDAAYRSGKPAIGVGPGNAPALITSDADLAHVAQSVVMSKSFDNGLICGAENHLVVEASARTELVSELMKHGAAILDEAESERFKDAAVSPDTCRFLPPIVGMDAATLAELAHIERPYPLRLLVVPTELISTTNYLAAEKLAPVVSLFTVPDAEAGLKVCRTLLEIDGRGHTAIIHSQNVPFVRRFTEAIDVSRILVNSPGTHGVIGLTSGLTPSMTLGSGTWGGNSTTNNITYRDLLNIKRVAYYTPAGHGSY
jgi:acyl-CoA reductase-like NAD-dependent aldehyde dehydrogenase